MEDNMAVIAVAGCIAVIQIVLIFTILQISNKLSELIEIAEKQQEIIERQQETLKKLDKSVFELPGKLPRPAVQSTYNPNKHY
ncbi:hypothetical protein [Ruminococcus albus]|uniref:Uncharacterized protein n=1 Tax=Ruminococcus albus TaxID=1264 RepID=A0A1I1P134_RUMAL|nr:hypothetical protein [Ruminococcus albus]SFC99670.1 hypothetical protein SAMN02910406_02842 [Ruminococcus albus]